MTKTSRLMLAVLALCGTSAALAQSSVTLYGRVNTTIENTKFGSGKSVTGLNNNSSYVGFRGVEDLGGGLKAGFVLESAFKSDDGAAPGGGGINFTRQSEVNLSGNFGMLRLGAFDAASYLATADYISMHNHDTGLSADALYAYVMRTGNQVAYRTPELGGFTAEVQHSFHEQVQGGRNAWDLALNYNNGPLGLGFGYSNAPTSVAGYSSAKGQQAALRASYSVGALTLGAYYQYAKLQDVNLSSSDAKRHAARLSAMYTLGSSEFHANVGRANKVKFNGSSVTGSAATQWTLGYNYNLSKRTKVYGYYTKLSDGKAELYGDLRSIAVGVRHLF